MSSSPLVINNHSYHDTSSSTCSSPDISLNKKSSPQISDNKKDPIYWSQRSKNNLSAKRSRVKRRMNDLVLETKLTQLNNENEILRAKIDMLTRKFGHLTNEQNQQIPKINDSVTTTEELSSMPIKRRFKSLNITSDS
jgi:vrille protein